VVNTLLGLLRSGAIKVVVASSFKTKSIASMNSSNKVYANVLTNLLGKDLMSKH